MKDGLRLLYLIDSLAPGGAERSLAALAPAYVDRGVILEVAYLVERPGLHRQLEAAGARVVSVAGRGGRAAYVRRIRRLVAERQPDLVHTTLYEADVTGRPAARTSGVPVVSSLVSVIYGAQHRADPRLRPSRVVAAWALDALTARMAVRFHAPSVHVADVMGRRLRIPRGRIDVVPRGRDPQVLGEPNPRRRSRGRETVGVGGDTPVILAVARHEYAKGLDLLLGALPSVLRRIPEAVLVVAGREGAQTTELRSRATDAGLAQAVRFLGPRDDVADLLCAADVFVLPSRWEGLPGAVLEAMAMGAPIVASDIPPVREVLGGEDTGRLVTPEQPERLADALVASLSDRVGAERRAAQARKRFHRLFTVDAVADRMLDFYGRAISASPRR